MDDLNYRNSQNWTKYKEVTIPIAMDAKDPVGLSVSQSGTRSAYNFITCLSSEGCSFYLGLLSARTTKQPTEHEKTDYLSQTGEVHLDL